MKQQFPSFGTEERTSCQSAPMDKLQNYLVEDAQYKESISNTKKERRSFDQKHEIIRFTNISKAKDGVGSPVLRTSGFSNWKVKIF